MEEQMDGKKGEEIISKELKRLIRPKFKASYFGVNIFKQQIILQEMELTKPNLDDCISKIEKLKEKK